MTSKHMQRCLTSLVIREIQDKTTKPQENIIICSPE